MVSLKIKKKIQQSFGKLNLKYFNIKNYCLHVYVHIY